MSLSSPEYFLFLALLFFAFWLIRRMSLPVIGLILLADYFFYAKWSLIYLAIIPLAGSVDFLIGYLLEQSQRTVLRRLLVATSVAMNVGLIIAGKYVPLLTGGVTLPIVLPLGLSFYAFQAMTYTVDIYRGDAPAAKSYWKYLASVAFFPTTLAGPITRVSSLVTQWEKGRKSLTPEDGGRALFLIASGLAKKFLIADYLGSNLVNRVFDLPTLYSGGEALIAVYAYAFQLYYDFSGYSDLAIGSALLLGIKLPANFNRPYIAENVADFWRRWHISLSNWLRDYLYFALPGKRSKWLPYLNLVITMTLGGLWHGANWTFAVWGLLHGLGLAAVRLRETILGKQRSASIGAVWLRRVLTFHFVCLGWVFFRAADFETARQVLAQIGSLHFGFDNVSAGVWVVLAVGAAIHLTPKDWQTRLNAWFCGSPGVVQAAALAGLVMAIQYVSATGAAPFVYTKF